MSENILNFMADNTEHNENFEESYIEYDGEPIIEFEHHKDRYIADWDCLVDQNTFFKYLQRLEYPHYTKALIQSSNKYPKKQKIILFEALKTIDTVTYLAFDLYDRPEGGNYIYGLTWYKDDDAPAKIEFEATHRSSELLTELFCNTHTNLREDLKFYIDKILNYYPLQSNILP
jgi:hypothetical protein